MALQPIRIPTRNQSQPIVDEERRPTAEFVRWLNDTLGQVALSVNAIAALPEIQAALVSLDAATTAAQVAADSANAAAAGASRDQALANSYITPASVLSATTTTVTIAAHTRHYADGTSVPVNGGSIPATAPGDTDYVSYLDPSRAGGTVAYVVSTTQPVQTGDTHVVGAVTIPATGTVSGGRGPQVPGFVEP